MMQNIKTFYVLFVAATSLLFACNPSQTADQCLNDDDQRMAMIGGIAHHPAYMAEMMNEMMNSDSSKQMMAQSMMSDPRMMTIMMDNMMSMSKNDTSMFRMMMGKSMEMCDADSSKCNMMMGAMQPHSNVMKSMQGMCAMNHMSMTSHPDHMKNERPAKGMVYTCPMHPQITKDKPGKCPICGMDLVKKN